MKIQTVPDVIKLLNASSEEAMILKYENILARMFLSPILLLSSILYFVLIYIVLKQDIKITLTNSLFPLGFYLLLETFSRTIKNEKLKGHIISMLFSAVLVFVVLRFYYLIGPVVWTIAISLAIISMLRISRSTLLIISITTFLLGMYVWYKSYPFYIGPIYYATQTISFTILFLLLEVFIKSLRIGIKKFMNNINIFQHRKMKNP